MGQTENRSSDKSHKKKTDRTNTIAKNFVWEQLKRTSNAGETELYKNLRKFVGAKKTWALLTHNIVSLDFIGT